MLARIRKDAPRYSMWLQTFGSDTIPVLEPPKRNNSGALRVLVDVTRLDSGQQQRLAKKLASQWRVSSDRVLADLLASGSTPISGEDVEVVEESARLF